MVFSSRFFVKILVLSTACLFLSFLLAGADRIFGIIYSPKVISVFPETNSQDIPLGSKLIINFDKPINRRAIEYSIFPQAYGEWKFENPLIKNPASPAGRHLFKTLVFEPAVDFSESTDYEVKIERIKGFGNVKNNFFSFTFKTKGAEQVQVLANNETATSGWPEITLIKTVFNWQKYRLSCEAASLKMALSAKGINVSEDEIMEKIGYDPTPHENNIWGDPDSAYVGDIDGKICDTGYGVHWQPLAKAANNWREAEAFSGWDLKKLINEIKLGNPVVMWGTLPVGAPHDYSWYTPQGKYIKTYRETHVRLVVGFMGDPENPTKIIMDDPLSGKLYWETDYFLKNWKAFDRSGVAIR
ncbi:MAG: C39 family peptidase [Patescibacteria group bacterium]